MVKNNSKNSVIIMFTAVLISVIFTPVNFDALIIPKIAILFCMALYFLPQTLKTYHKISSNNKKFFFTTLLSLIFFQYIIMIILSDSVIEQQIFGRTGRGLGLLTHVSLIILMLASATFIDRINFNLLIACLVFSCFISSVYSIMQKYNLDIFEWNSKTNGIIGTLGNPNHQGVFVAMALVPSAIYLLGKKFKFYLVPISIVFSLYMIYIIQATQGYISAGVSIISFTLIYLWFKNKYIFVSTFFLALVSFILVVLGTLNRGLLSEYLYKISVQSRGDFWRSAFRTANANPLFGGGFDSFGDNYLLYRDTIAANHPFAEMTDNAHNYLLEYAATGGYPLMTYHILIILFTAYSFILQMKNLAKFDLNLITLFVAWLAFQAHTVVSPGNIVLMVWNSILSGAIIGLSLNKSQIQISKPIKTAVDTSKFSVVSYLLFACGLVVVAPLYNSDRLLLKGLTSTDSTLVFEQVNKYPRSSVKFNLVGQTYIRSNLPTEALEVGRAAVRFNPNAASGWGLILVNPLATVEEKKEAKAQILRLDPLNKEVYQFKF